MKNTLESYREARGLTYQALADASGLNSRGAVFCHCTGKRRISPESAICYEKNLGIPRSDLRPDLWPPAQPEPTDAA